MNANVGASMLTRIKGVEVGISPIGVTVARGVSVAVYVGVRVMVVVAVALAVGVSGGIKPGRKSRTEHACNKSTVIIVRTSLRIKNLVCEELLPL